MKRAAQRPRILLTDNVQSGAALVSTVTNIIKVYKACEGISVDILSFALELEEN